MRTGYLHYYSFPFVRREVNIRDFKIRYGKGLLGLQKVKITSGDVTMRVAVRLSRRSLVFCCVKLPSLLYSSLREYKLSLLCHFYFKD